MWMRYLVRYLSPVAVAGVAVGAWLTWRYVASFPAEPRQPTLELVPCPPLHGGHYGGLAVVAISPDGACLASGSWDKLIALWDTATSRQTGTLEAHTHAVSALAWSPDSQSLVSGGWDGAAHVWDATTHQRRYTLRRPKAPSIHDGWVRAVAWSPDGRWLATAGDDHAIRLWQANTGALVANLTGHRHGVTSLAFDPANAGRLLSGARDGTLRLWSLPDATQLTVWGQPATGPDGHNDWGDAHRGHVMWVGWLDGYPLSAGTDGRLCVWAPDQLTAPMAQWPAHRGGVYAASASAAHGGVIASVGSDRSVRLWSRWGQPLAAARLHAAPVMCVALAPDGRWVASGGWDNRLKLCQIIPTPGSAAPGLP